MKNYIFGLITAFTIASVAVAYARTPFPPWLSKLAGDITIDRDGTSAIGDAKVVLADIASAAVDSDNIVDGTVALVDIASAAVDSDNIVDATIDSVDYANGSLDEVHLAVPTVEGLQAARLAVAKFAFGTDGSTGSSASGVVIPDNATIQFCWLDIQTTMGSAGGAGTIAIQANAANDILSAVDADTISGTQVGVPTDAIATFVRTTAARDLTFVVGTEDITSGAFTLFCEYVVGD